jgi:uncharacterized protein YbcI
MDEQRQGKSPAAMISTATVQLLHDYTGRGPTKAKTMDTLTRGHDFQLAMRDGLVAIVERQLERKVIAFMSQNQIDPDLAVEVFVLEPSVAA